MKEITLKEACKKVREKMKEDKNFRKEYETIKKLLGVIFEEENIEEFFYEKISEEDVMAFVKNLLSKEFVSRNFEIDKIEIIPNKTVLIRGRNHLDIDEFNAVREVERSIILDIEAFTGYSADVSL